MSFKDRTPTNHKTTKRVHNRRLKDEVRGYLPLDRIQEHEKEPPVGDLLYPHSRLWITGEVFLRPEDDEGHLLKPKLAAVLAELSHRLDETATPTRRALLLNEQVVAEDLSTLPRRYSQQTSKRFTLDQAAVLIQHNQGRTIRELAPIFFPHHPAPELMEPRIRVMLNKMQHRGLIAQRKLKRDQIRWFIVDKPSILWANQRVKLFGELIAKVYGGHAEDYIEAAKLIETAVDHNLSHKFIADKWEDPANAPF